VSRVHLHPILRQWAPAYSQFWDILHAHIRYEKQQPNFTRWSNKMRGKFYRLYHSPCLAIRFVQTNNRSSNYQLNSHSCQGWQHFKGKQNGHCSWSAGAKALLSPDRCPADNDSTRAPELTEPWRKSNTCVKYEFRPNLNLAGYSNASQIRIAGSDIRPSLHMMKVKGLSYALFFYKVLWLVVYVVTWNTEICMWHNIQYFTQ